MTTIGEMMESDEEFAAEEAKHFPKGNGLAVALPRENDVEPLLPDNGIGMDYDAARAMLAAKHNSAVGMDDPIMMAVTLSNVQLNEMEKLNRRHNEALTKIMAEQSGKYLDGIKSTTDELGKVLADNSVEAIRKIFQSHGRALTINTNNAKWCAGIMAVSALVQVAMMAVKMWR